MIYKNNCAIFKDIIKFFLNKRKGNFIDFSYGNGYHSKIILKSISKGNLLSFEIDKENFLKNNISKKNFFILNKCFSNIKNIKIKSLNTIILDIGFTENQILNFSSFKCKKNLICLNELGNKFDILSLINFGKYKEIYKIFKNFENSFFCKKLCKYIIQYRKKIFILHNSQIKDIILKTYKNIYRNSKKNIFTKFFYAILDYCSNNKEKIKKLINYIVNVIRVKGRIIIITFNSYESKVIKKIFKKEKNFFLLTKKNEKNKTIRIYEKKKIISCNRI
ncbi:16S rRNA (cytosine(1402)-N(4))-methyltransferase [Candidatus Vidania fulgoroideorum]